MLFKYVVIIDFFKNPKVILPIDFGLALKNMGHPKHLKL